MVILSRSVALSVSLTLKASLFQLYNRTGKAVLLEDCGNGNPARAQRDAAGGLDCPMNLYRSSSDLHPAWHSVLNNLNSTMAYHTNGLSGPGCWACKAPPFCCPTSAPCLHSDPRPCLAQTLTCCRRA